MDLAEDIKIDPESEVPALSLEARKKAQCAVVDQIEAFAMPRLRPPGGVPPGTCGFGRIDETTLCLIFAGNEPDLRTECRAVFAEIQAFAVALDADAVRVAVQFEERERLPELLPPKGYDGAGCDADYDDLMLTSFAVSPDALRVVVRFEERARPGEMVCGLEPLPKWYGCYGWCLHGCCGCCICR